MPSFWRSESEPTSFFTLMLQILLNGGGGGVGLSSHSVRQFKVSVVMAQSFLMPTASHSSHMLSTPAFSTTKTGGTVLPAKSDSDVVFCLQLSSKTF